MNLPRFEVIPSRFMKKAALYFLIFLAASAFAQDTYNFSLGPLSVADTLTIGERYAVWSHVTNSSTGSIDRADFTWYLSKDTILDASDVLTESISIAKGDLTDSFLKPKGWVDVASVISQVPASYTVGCTYYVIMKLAIVPNYPETNTLDNIKFRKVCLRNRRTDLEAIAVSPNRTNYLIVPSMGKCYVTTTLRNVGEFDVNQAFKVRLQLGSSADPSSGGIATRVKTVPKLTVYNNATVLDTFDISSLPKGTYYLFSAIDVENTVAEAKEWNNTKSISFTISPIDTARAGYLKMPKGDSVRYVAACNIKLYDNGGPDSNYWNNTKSLLTIYPAEPNKMIRVKRILNDYQSPDYLQVSSCTGNVYMSGTEFVSPCGAMDFLLSTDASTNKKGSELEITCADKLDYEVISITGVNKSVFCRQIDTITFSASVRNKGWGQHQLRYEYGLTKSASYSDKVYSAPSTGFTTPGINSSSTINASVDLTKISLPDTGTYYLYIKVGINNPDKDTTNNVAFYPVKIFRMDTVENANILIQDKKYLFLATCNSMFYDDGGAMGNYSNNVKGTVSIYPSQKGKIIRIDYGEIDIAYKDLLTIRDPNSESSSVSEVNNNSSGHISNRSPYKFKAFRYDFSSDASTVGKGFAIKIGCVSTGKDYQNYSVSVPDTAWLGYNKKVKFKNLIAQNASENMIDLAVKLYVSTSKNLKDTLYSTKLMRYSRFQYVIGTYLISDTLNIQKILKTGKYYVLSQLDPTKIHQELDLTNNWAIDSMIVAPFPNNQIRFPEFGIMKDTVCDKFLFPYDGPGNKVLLPKDSSLRVTGYPKSAAQKLEVTIDKFQVVNAYQTASVYDDVVSTTQPVLQVVYSTVLPVKYTAAQAGKPLRVILKNSDFKAFDVYLSGRFTCRDMVTSTEEKRLSIQLEKNQLFPNPAHDWVEVAEEGQKSIYNATGQLIYQTSSSRIELSDWASGLYRIVIDTENGFVYHTLVKR